MPLPSTTSKSSLSVEIDVGRDIRALTFSTNGEYLIVGGHGIRVWRTVNGEQVATTEKIHVYSLAVSDDGRWIAGGTTSGVVSICDTETYEEVIVLKQGTKGIYAVDFSPDSTYLLAASYNYKAIVWDVARRKQVQILPHDSPVRAAKYSPQGDRIATAVWNSVRVWDSNNGCLLVDIPARVTPYYNTSLLWFKSYLLVTSEGTIKQFEASTGTAFSEWPGPHRDHYTSIALPRHQQFIAYTTKGIITFRDTSTFNRLDLVRHSQNVHSIAFSPDDRLLAIGGCDGKIIIWNLSYITDSIPLSRLHPTFREPDIRVDDVVLDSLRRGQLRDAEATLTAAILEYWTPSVHILACRALVRARLGHFDAALVDAQLAIKIQPSIIAYIAKSMAHVGKRERDEGYRACDIAFERFHSTHASFLLLVKAVVVFIAGKHHDAISRLDDLIATVHHNAICCVVQAHMYLLLGDLDVESSNFKGAAESFERARAQMRHHTSRTLSVISLIFGWKFDNFPIMIRQRLCEAWHATNRTREAVEFFHEIANEWAAGANLQGEHRKWALDFAQRASSKLDDLGDEAVEAEKYHDAISHYTVALSLNPPSPQDILIKRSKAFLVTELWSEALDDANQVNKLDPQSPWAYETKHAALHKLGNYSNAVVAFEMMLRKMRHSADPDVQEHANKYIRPSKTRAKIRKIVHRTLSPLPRVLINTITGRLCDRAQQSSAFQTNAIFDELVSSTTTRIDYARIRRAVGAYFRYVVLSHTWEKNEPLFEQVVHIAVHDLDGSPSHDKLQTFCKIVWDAGFHWAWSDTCCIDKDDHFVHQEALVMMFRWYQDSAMMIVFLWGVHSSSQRGALMQSFWNTRSWTLQEYIAAKVVRFYTEDWVLYRGLDVPNHKESLEIAMEMEQATGMSAQQLRLLSSGLTDIREKLRLASTRRTTRVEDVAYSLLGIFAVTGLPVVYGEGDGALGRLLAHILDRSGDANILAWTGESGSFNSCLPVDISVFNEPPSSHLPSFDSDADLDEFSPASDEPLNLDVALKFYNRLNELPRACFTDNLLRLPCIAFRLPPFSTGPAHTDGIYYVDTLAFGTVEIKTKQDVSQMLSLYLVHPWLDALLERKPSGTPEERGFVPPPSPDTDEEELPPDNVDVDVPESETPPQLSSLEATPSADEETRARRLIHQLRQPFGALLLAPTEMDYKRVATDGLVTVQLREEISLAELVGSVCTLDVFSIV